MPSDKAVVHVIDDDEAMRESLAFLLSAAGMEVRTYESAMGFLDVAPKVEAGCVITDVRMPEVSGIDLLPTFCSMAELSLPQGVVLDGRDISEVLTKGASSPHDEILLFNNEDVVSIRTQQWKYVEQTYYRGSQINFNNRDYKELYDETRDVSESYSVAATYPEVTSDMQKRLKQAQETFSPFKRGIPPFFQQMRNQPRKQD